MFNFSLMMSFLGRWLAGVLVWTSNFAYAVSILKAGSILHVHARQPQQTVSPYNYVGPESTRSQMPKHEEHLITLKNESGQLVLQTSLHIPADQVAAQVRDLLERENLFICDSSGGPDTRRDRASELGLCGPESGPGSYQLNLYYWLCINGEGERMVDILRTVEADPEQYVFNEQIILPSQVGEETTNELEVRKNNKKCTITVKLLTKDASCSCTRTASKSHCIKSTLQPIRNSSVQMR